jgi:hypothetical protein
MSLRAKFVNVLLGLLLLFVFSLPLFLAYAALEFSGQLFWPHIADRLARFGPPDEILELGAVAAISIALVLQSLLRRKWMGAFYSLGIFAIGIATRFVEAHVPNFGRPVECFLFR